MEDLLPYINILSKQASFFTGWFVKNVASWNIVIQASVVAGIVFLSRFLSEYSGRWFEAKFKKKSYKALIRIHASYREIFLLFFVSVFLWCAVMLAHGAKLPGHIIKTAASLSTAWGIIRFTSSVIESHFWSRLIAINLWTIAALNIVGWLEATISFMESAAVTVGDVKISVLLMIKSLFAFMTLFWIVGALSNSLERNFKKTSGLTPSQRALLLKLGNIGLYTFSTIIGLNMVGIDLMGLTVISGGIILGVGFGLQKAFGNLISGIILLLDKSIKPGDIISVGNSFGIVDSMGGRCVSVMMLDGKERLIPNENLITNEVENWSYSIKRVRIRIPISVSYDSDVKLVKKILLEAANDHPRIMKDPGPICLITNFGDYGIHYEIFAWIDDPENGVLGVNSDLYFQLWEMFKEHGITIPYPQQDIHIKASKSVRAELLDPTPYIEP